MTAREISEAANLSAGGRAAVDDGMTPEACLAALEERGLYEDAVRFLAHKLPARAGVQWAAQCIRELAPAEQKGQPNESLEAAERWVQAPADPARRAAKESVDRAKATGSAELAALAAFFSGGSLGPPGGPNVPPPPYAAQRMVAGAVRIAVVAHEPQRAGERYRQALAVGRRPEVECLA